MNDLPVGIYFFMFAIVAGSSFAFMFVMMRTTIEAVQKPKRNVHPEMTEVQTGDELLVFKPEEDDDEEPDTVVVRR